MTAPEKGGLAGALARVQAKLPKVGKDNTADAGQYSYRYADLADITEALFPVLAGEGLSFTALPTLDSDGRFVLEYALLHQDGESREGRYPLANGNPQAMGSSITYARRYALCAVTGLAPGADDDDGAAAAEQQRQYEQQQRRERAQQNRRQTETPKSEADQIRDAIREFALGRADRGWRLDTVAAEYAKEFPGRTLRGETDTDALNVFFANLQVEAQREDDQLQAGEPS